MSMMTSEQTAQTKVKVALEALKGEKTLAELAASNHVDAMDVEAWRNQALDAIAVAFAGKGEDVWDLILADTPTQLANCEDRLPEDAWTYANMAD